MDLPVLFRFMVLSWICWISLISWLQLLWSFCLYRSNTEEWGVPLPPLLELSPAFFTPCNWKGNYFTFRMPVQMFFWCRSVAIITGYVCTSWIPEGNFYCRQHVCSPALPPTSPFGGCDSLLEKHRSRFLFLFFSVELQWVCKCIS